MIPSSFGTKSSASRNIKKCRRDETNSVTLTSLIAFVLEIPARNITMDGRLDWRPSGHRLAVARCKTQSLMNVIPE